MARQAEVALHDVVTRSNSRASSPDPFQGVWQRSHVLPVQDELVTPDTQHIEYQSRHIDHSRNHLTKLLYIRREIFAVRISAELSVIQRWSAFLFVKTAMT